MLKATRGIRTIRIPDDEKNAYISLGYAVTDMEGRAVYSSGSVILEETVSVGQNDTTASLEKKASARKK